MGESCSVVEMCFFTCRFFPNYLCAVCPVAEELESQVPSGTAQLVQGSGLIWAPHDTYRISYRAGKVADVI